MNDGNRPVFSVQRLEDRVGDGVITAERHDLCAGRHQFCHRRFDLINGEFNVERIDGNIPGVDHLCERKRFGVLSWVVGAKQPR